MRASIIPQGTQLDMFGQDVAPVTSTSPRPSREGLRNGHLIANCGDAAFDYLVAYATQRGLAIGPATRAGKKVRGKLVSLLIVQKQLVRACFAHDAKESARPRIRRLSAARFCRLCDALAAKKGGAPA